MQVSTENSSFRGHHFSFWLFIEVGTTPTVPAWLLFLSKALALNPNQVNLREVLIKPARVETDLPGLINQRSGTGLPPDLTGDMNRSVSLQRSSYARTKKPTTNTRSGQEDRAGHDSSPLADGEQDGSQRRARGKRGGSINHKSNYAQRLILMCLLHQSCLIMAHHGRDRARLRGSR